jgi:lipopolysaccharide biosynthesis glycosyltransferase
VSNLVITLAIGQEAEELYALSSDSIQAYARKISADFACIHQDVFSDSDIPPYYNKLKIGDYLEIYDRVLYLDCDLIVKPNTPNIFDLVPINAIGVINEACFNNYDQEIVGVKNALGQLDNWQEDYFNSGVIVVSKIHKPLFTFPQKIFPSPFYEQTYLNWQAHYLNYEIKYLPREFNYIFVNTPDLNLEIPESAYIVHFAGWGFNLPKSQNSHKHTYKYHQMQCFLDLLEGKKTIRIHAEQLHLKEGYVSKQLGLKKLIIPARTFDLISYGPYKAINKGLYNITINFNVINISSPKSIAFKFDIVSNCGDRLWYRNDVCGDLSFELTLEIEDVTDLEFRFFGTGNEVEINFIELSLPE